MKQCRNCQSTYGSICQNHTFFQIQQKLLPETGVVWKVIIGKLQAFIYRSDCISCTECSYGVPNDCGSCLACYLLLPATAGVCIGKEVLVTTCFQWCIAFTARVKYAICHWKCVVSGLPNLVAQKCAGSFSWQQWIDAEWPSLPSICMGKRTPCHPASGLTLACRMKTLRSCSAVSSPKKQMRTQRNAWSSSGTGPVQRMATAVQPLTVCWRTVFSLTVMGCSHSGWVSSAQKQDGDQYPPKTIQHYPVGL